VGFYASSSLWVKQLDADGLFDAFEWGVDEVTVRVGDHETVRISSNGATCFMATRVSDCDRVRQVLSRSLEAIGPSDVGMSQMSVKYLIPMEGADLRSACAVLAASVCGNVGAKWTDVAVLADGESDKLRATYQVEYGIVGRDELIQRLTQYRGRIEGQLYPVALDLEDLPSCGFFSDWIWNLWRPMADDVFVGVVETWDSVIKETERLAGEVYGRHIPGMIDGERVGQ